MAHCDVTMLELCESIEQDELDARSFPALVGLDRHRRRAALVLAVQAVSPENGAGAGLAEFTEVVRLAYGPGRELGDLAEELLELSGEGQAGSLERTREFSDLLDAARGCEQSACRSEATTRVASPVAQWLLWRRLYCRQKME